MDNHNGKVIGVKSSMSKGKASILEPEIALELLAKALEALRKEPEYQKRIDQLEEGYKNMKQHAEQIERKYKKIITASQRFRLAQQQGEIGGDN